MISELLLLYVLSAVCLCFWSDVLIGPSTHGHLLIFQGDLIIPETFECWEINYTYTRSKAYPLAYPACGDPYTTVSLGQRVLPR